MAFDFPASPTLGQEYTSGSVTYAWNGYGWGIKGTTYLPLAGGALTGDLSITKAMPRLSLDKPAALDGTDNQIIGKTGGVPMWVMSVGAHASDDFYISRYSAGAYASAPIQIRRATGSVLFAGSVAQNPAASVDNLAIVASGSYGGGIGFIDGASRAGIWAQASHLALATGGNPPATKLLLQSDNIHRMTGSMIAAGNITASHSGGVSFRERTPTHSVFHYTDNTNHYILLTNSGDPDGGWNGLRPFFFNLSNGNVVMEHQLNVSGHVYSAAGRLLGTNDGAFGNYMPTWGGTFTGLISTTNSVADIGYGACTNSLQVLSQTPTEPSITFHRQGAFAMNFGMDNSGNLAFGGWSHGGNRWQLWSQRDFNYTPAREGGSATFTDCYTTGNHHSNGNHYFLAGDGAWIRWRGDLGRIDTSHGWTIPDLNTGGINCTSIYTNGYEVNCGQARSYGTKTRQGWSGAHTSNSFNFDWRVNYMIGYIDDSDLGGVMMTSDYRVKKDVMELPSTWNAVKRLKPISFTYKDWVPPNSKTGEKLFVDSDIIHWGFFAHELQETLTEGASSGVKDDPVCVQSPNDLVVIAALTKALQEAMSRIEQLEERLSQ